MSLSDDVSPVQIGGLHQADHSPKLQHAVDKARGET
jgi:hypothetical protein